MTKTSVNDMVLYDSHFFFNLHIFKFIDNKRPAMETDYKG